jgi:hypothetical protein
LLCRCCCCCSPFSSSLHLCLHCCIMLQPPLMQSVQSTRP